MDRLLLVSADGHGGTSPETYREYLEPRFRDEIDGLLEEDQIRREFVAQMYSYSDEILEVIDPEGAMRAGGEIGALDIDVRLQEMDREGVAAELLIAGAQCHTLPFFATLNRRPYPPELRGAGVRAYHRWAADFIAGHEDRVLAVANPGPCHDMDETAREVKWIAERGFVAIAIPPEVEDHSLPPLHDPYFEPFWAACDEFGLTLLVHAGNGRPQGEMPAFFSRLAASGFSDREIMEKLHTSDESPFGLDMRPRRALWQLMLGGVFDRHPDLRLALTEVRADWIPPTLAYLDRRFEEEDTPLVMRPSEYWQRNGFVGASFMHKAEAVMRHEIGINQLMFGRDYPHFEGTWPNTWDWIRDAFADVPEDEARLILGENAVRCYGLDRAKLTTIADRIGPDARDVLTGPPIDPRRLQHFDVRGGYLRGPEQVDENHISVLFDEDLASVN